MMRSSPPQNANQTFSFGTLLPLGLIVLPILVHIWFVRAFAVSVPFADEWEFWWSMKGLDGGNWHHAFWIPHNEHRLVMTRLVYFVLRYTVALDVTVAMYLNVVLACLTLWGLWRMLRASGRVSLWAMVPVAFVVFSLEQWENMLWGWQIAIYMMVCGSVWALYFLSRPGVAKLGMAILCAVVASFSFVNGLMIWPAGLVYLLLARVNRSRLLGWVGAAAAILFVYFRNYVTQVTRPSPTQLVRPATLSEFFEAAVGLLSTEPFSLPSLIFANVGALLAPQNAALAVVSGLIVVVVFLLALVLLWRTRAVWSAMPLSLVALGLLSFLSSLTIVGGRMGYWDRAYMLTSRYTTITLLGIVATYLLTVVLATSKEPESPNLRRSGAVLCGIITLVILLGLPGGYRLGLAKGQEIRAQRLGQREIVLQFETRTDEELAGVYPKALRERLLYWKSRGLAPFNTLSK
ncbi:MAG: hypothetical protein IT328_27030 [Caldilineaceae bacterium]|nr:hypothetical protein [Caldilineaceae bacterium]